MSLLSVFEDAYIAQYILSFISPHEMSRAALRSTCRLMRATIAPTGGHYSRNKSHIMYRYALYHGNVALVRAIEHNMGTIFCTREARDFAQVTMRNIHLIHSPDGFACVLPGMLVDGRCQVVWNAKDVEIVRNGCTYYDAFDIVDQIVSRAKLSMRDDCYDSPDMAFLMHTRNAPPGIIALMYAMYGNCSACHAAARFICNDPSNEKQSWASDIFRILGRRSCARELLAQLCGTPSVAQHVPQNTRLLIHMMYGACDIGARDVARDVAQVFKYVGGNIRVPFVDAYDIALPQNEMMWRELWIEASRDNSRESSFAHILCTIFADDMERLVDIMLAGNVDLAREIIKTRDDIRAFTLTSRNIVEIAQSYHDITSRDMDPIACLAEFANSRSQPITRNIRAIYTCIIPQGFKAIRDRDPLVLHFARIIELLYIANLRSVCSSVAIYDSIKTLRAISQHIMKHCGCERLTALEVQIDARSDTSLTIFSSARIFAQLIILCNNRALFHMRGAKFLRTLRPMIAYVSLVEEDLARELGAIAGTPVEMARSFMGFR